MTTSEFPLRWKLFQSRHTFLRGPIALTHGSEPGRSTPSWTSSNLNDLLAGLLLVDLASVLDKALREVLARASQRGSSLHERIRLADNAGLVIDCAPLDELRVRRNEVAHSMAPLRAHELAKYVLAVETHLIHWRTSSRRSRARASTRSSVVQIPASRNDGTAWLPRRCGNLDRRGHRRTRRLAIRDRFSSSGRMCGGHNGSRIPPR
jgi:hypothetical protein